MSDKDIETILKRVDFKRIIDTFTGGLQKRLEKAEEHIKKQNETIARLEAAIEVQNQTEDHGEDESKVPTTLLSLPDEILLKIVKMAASKTKDFSCPKVPGVITQWKWCAAEGSDRWKCTHLNYNHIFVIDVINKISERFRKIGADNSLWRVVGVSFLDREDHIKTSQDLLGHFTEGFWVNGPCYRANDDALGRDVFYSASSRCPNLKILRLDAIGLEPVRTTLNQPWRLEYLYMTNVDTDWDIHTELHNTLPSLKVLEIHWTTLQGWTEQRGQLPDMTKCNQLKKISLRGLGYTFKGANLGEDTRHLPEGLKNLIEHPNCKELGGQWITKRYEVQGSGCFRWGS